MINRTTALASCVAIAGLCATSQAERQQTIRTTYYPPAGGVWERVRPVDAGWSSPALESLVEFVGQNKSTGLLVLDHGRVVAEHYWEVENPLLQNGLEYRTFRTGATPQGQPVEDVASVQKSVVSLLLGIAISRGVVQPDTAVSAVIGEGWSKASPAEERRILIRHLASMTSGLSEKLTFEVEAGTRWFYNTPAYSFLLRVLTRASGLTADELTEQWLLRDIGATDTRWVMRPSGGPNTVGLATTVRDLGRVGILVTSGGSWAGKQVVPSAWLRGIKQASQPLNPSYGLLWWVNNGDAWEDWDHKGTTRGSFVPPAPAELVLARGVGDRRLYILPSRQIVVVRIGATARFNGDEPDLQFLDRELWARLMKALPMAG